MLIRVWVERTQPLAGTAATGGLEPRRFDGWLELLTVLSELLAAASLAGQDEDATGSEAAMRESSSGERDEPT